MYGVEIPVPVNSEIYLQKTYGEMWGKPDIRFSHPWNRDEYSDIAGIRNRPIMWTRGELHANQARQRGVKNQTTVNRK